MTEFAPGLINDRWALIMPRHRVDFHAARPLWEAGRLASCYERIEPGMVVYDVGAEHGDFTALYRSWGADVAPFEPSPPYWPCIRETYEANGFGTPRALFGGFAGDETAGEGNPTVVRDGWPLDAWEPNSDEDIGQFRHLAQDTATPRTRLDDFAIATRVVPEVIVIDIEGAEYRALVGCEALLKTIRPLLYVSVHDIGEWNSLGGWYGKTAEDLHTLMATFDYKATLLPGHGEGEHFWLYEPV